MNTNGTARPRTDDDVRLIPDPPAAESRTPSPSPSPRARSILAQLAAPFSAGEVEWLPKNVSGNRALAIPYLSTAAIMQRLDDVLGLSWKCESQVLASGCVMCKLSIRVGDEWVERSDVGSPSDQPDAGDKVKAAFSDALKRAAVRFGVGRYLHNLPAIWSDFDAQKKQFAKEPQLPAWALPKQSRSINH